MCLTSAGTDNVCLTTALPVAPYRPAGTELRYGGSARYTMPGTECGMLFMLATQSAILRPHLVRYAVLKRSMVRFAVRSAGMVQCAVLREGMVVQTLAEALLETLDGRTGTSLPSPITQTVLTLSTYPYTVWPTVLRRMTF